MTRGLRHGRFGRRLSHVSLGKDLGEIRFRRSPRADFKALRCHCTVHGAGVVAGSDFAKFCVCVASAHQIGHLEHLDRPTLMPEDSIICGDLKRQPTPLLLILEPYCTKQLGMFHGRTLHAKPKLLVGIFLHGEFSGRIHLNKIVNFAHRPDFQGQFLVKRDISWHTVLVIYLVTPTSLPSAPCP